MGYKNPAARDPFKQNKMRFYFKFSMIAFAVVIGVAVVSLITKTRQDRIDYSKSDFVQYQAPDDSASVVVFETTEGTFKAVLYDEEAPHYCKYFKDLVESGYFNDTYVCTILRSGEYTGGFITGSKTADGLANDDTNTEMVKLEISPNLLPTTGALGSLVSQGGTFSSPKAGSVFAVFADVVNVEEMRAAEAEDVNGYSRVCGIFEKYGGVPNYLQTYTLFGQVYDGWDTIEKINSVRIVDENVPDDDKDKSYQPEREIKITKAYLSTYGEQKQNGFTIPLKEQTTKDVSSAADDSSK